VTRYSNGTAFENKVKALLIADGYWCVRAAGSRGAADLVAIKSGQILLVQVKRTNPIIPRAERIELFRVAQIIRAIPLVAFQPAPRKPVEYRRLLGYEPSQWETWTSDEVVNA
jgi:Holliday junction resolvase